MESSRVENSVLLRERSVVFESFLTQKKVWDCEDKDSTVGRFALCFCDFIMQELKMFEAW